MILTKDEFLKSLNGEVRLLLHLVSKVDPAKLDYRPTPKQRSTLELLQYLAIVGPIHCRGVLADGFSIDAWRDAWNAGEAASHTLDLQQVKASIAAQPAIYADLLNAFPDGRMREEFEMFGWRDTRGAWLVNLLLQHYAAYRMQLFLYLKSSGREELNTMNLWAGMDMPM